MSQWDKWVNQNEILIIPVWPYSEYIIQSPELIESLKSLQGVQDQSWTELKKTMGTSASLVGFCKSSTVSWENTRYLIVFYTFNSIISTSKLVLFGQTIVSDAVFSTLAALLLSCSGLWLFDFVVWLVSWPVTFGDLFSAEHRKQRPELDRAKEDHGNHRVTCRIL